MNDHLYSYAQIQARKQLPALHRVLGRVEREIEYFQARVEVHSRSAEFSADGAKTCHREARRVHRLNASGFREVLRKFYTKREQLLAAIAEITTPLNPARRLSAEARRALAELPGTRPVVMSIGQRALCRALGAEPSLTGTAAKSHKHKTRRSCNSRLQIL